MPEDIQVGGGWRPVRTHEDRGASMLWLVAAAWAMDVRVFAPSGTPIAGRATEIEVVVADGDQAVAVPVQISAVRGRISDTPRLVAPGRWRFAWVVPDGVREERFAVTVGERRPIEVTMTVGTFHLGDVRAPEIVDASASDPTIDLRFPISGTLRPEDVVVRATEGQVAEVVVEGTTLRVALTPDPRRDARMLHVGVWDRRRPDTVPVLASVRVREEKSGTVVVEPNAVVTVKVNGRSYGPFRADAAGAAEIRFEVFPGEATYEVAATDDVGNTSRVSNPLGGVAARPTALLLEGDDEERATVMVAAWSAAGTPWTGAAPVCRAVRGERTEAVPVGRGLWRYDIPDPRSLTIFDLRVECQVGDASAAARVPVGGARADRIDLRAWPVELDADFPIAQVQALLLDARGDRLPAEGLELTADHGWLALTHAADAVRADYQGSKAVAAGGDMLTARWQEDATTNPPWNLHVWGRRVGAGIDATVLVHDRTGRRVTGAEVGVVVVDGGAPGARVTGTTGADGRVRLTLPGGGALPVLMATAGGAAGAAALLPGAEGTDPLPDDVIEAKLPLPIRAGRVRSVVVEVTGAPVETGAEVSTPVRVRLFDLDNRPITDEQVKIDADYGSIAGWRADGDGSWTGTYVAPRAIVERAVQLTASADGTSGAATLRLVPRRVRGGVGLNVGYVSNFSLVDSPIVGLTGDYRMPFLEPLSVRLGASGYYVRTSFTDDQTSKAVNVDLNYFPIDLGGFATQRWTRLSIGGGVAALFVPYGIRATFAGTTAEEGAGMTQPGLQIAGEAAYRLGMSELTLTARGLIFPGPTGVVTFDEPTVHLAVGAGYRVLY